MFMSQRSTPVSQRYMISSRWETSALYIGKYLTFTQNGQASQGKQASSIQQKASRRHKCFYSIWYRGPFDHVAYAEPNPGSLTSRHLITQFRHKCNWNAPKSQRKPATPSRSSIEIERIMMMQVTWWSSISLKLSTPYRYCKHSMTWIKVPIYGDY